MALGAYRMTGLAFLLNFFFEYSFASLFFLPGILRGLPAVSLDG